MAKGSKVSPDLAIFGAPPRFHEDVHVSCPSSPDRNELMRLIGQVLDTHRYSNDGPLMLSLESLLANYLGVRNCVLVSNGTIALQILVRALGLKGEVILPAFTFVASANALLWEGVKPVFCDVKPGFHNLNPEHCRQLITPDTTAILGVHVWGVPCDIDSLTQIAANHNIPLIFDAAHAFGCGLDNKLIGNFGIAEVFSFHATKAFHTGEGGAITTNDDELAEKLRRIRNFGFVEIDKTACLGINAKMSELHAALGLANFSKWNQNLDQSMLIHNKYCSLLKDLPDLEIIRFEQPHNHHYVVARLSPDGRLSRDEVLIVLASERILARRYFYPGCHRLAPYGSTDQNPILPETEALADQCLVLPAGSNLSIENVKIICDTLKLAFDNCEAVRPKLVKNDY